jgi:hypothetical protein
VDSWLNKEDLKRISGRVKFLLLAWAGMPKTSFRKNSDSPLFLLWTIYPLTELLLDPELQEALNPPCLTNYPQQ